MGASIGLRFLVQDPFSSPTSPKTLFDDIDFKALDIDMDGRVDLGPDVVGSQGVPATGADASMDAYRTGYNLIRGRFMTHDHYDMLMTATDG